jgi:hypothetical protein
VPPPHDYFIVAISEKENQEESSIPGWDGTREGLFFLREGKLYACGTPKRRKTRYTFFSGKSAFFLLHPQEAPPSSI